MLGVVLEVVVAVEVAVGVGVVIVVVVMFSTFEDLRLSERIELSI